MHKIMRAWDAGHNKVKYVYRDEETKRTNLGEAKFDWYFFVKNSDYETHRSTFTLLKEQRKVVKYEQESHYTRVYIDRTHASELLDKDCNFVWEYRDREFFEVKELLRSRNIQTYEADLLVHKRWMIDNDIQFESEFKIVGLDIETDDEHLTGQIDPSRCKVLSCAFKDFITGKEAWVCAKSRSDEHEKEVLELIARVIATYDVLCGWNLLGFDAPVLKTRFAMYGIQIDWRKKFLQDHMQIYKKLGPQLPSYSLDYVAKAVTGEGKMEHEEKIFELFLCNKPKLREYNLIDVRRMFEIEAKTKFLSIAREMNLVGKCPCDDIYITRKIDNLLLRQTYEDQLFHFKTKVKQSQEELDDEGSFEGAIVFNPVSGVYEDVNVLDFHALYVTVVQTFNISPDTIIEKEMNVPENLTITTPAGHKFRKDMIGIIPKLMMNISNMRDKYKGIMKSCSDKSSVEYKNAERSAYAFKAFALSFYGAMGLRTSRFYDVRIAESTTLGGQFFTKTIASYLESIGHKILAGDTDSLFLSIKDRNAIPGIVEKINAICKDKVINQFNCDVSHLSMEHDKTFKKLMILKAKKRYAGYLTYMDGKEIPSQLYVKGLEYVRTDSSKLLKQEQKALIIKCLDGDTSETQMKDLIHKLRNFVLYQLNDIEMIKIAQKLTKEVEEYAVDLAHLKVVEDLRSKGIQVYVGDKIDYFIESQDREGKPIPKAARFFDGKFDRLYFWAKKLYPALERILESVFPKTDWSRYKDFGSTKKMANSRQGRMDLW